MNRDRETMAQVDPQNCNTNQRDGLHIVYDERIHPLSKLYIKEINILVINPKSTD